MSTIKRVSFKIRLKLTQYLFEFKRNYIYKRSKENIRRMMLNLHNKQYHDEIIKTIQEEDRCKEEEGRRKEEVRCNDECRRNASRRRIAEMVKRVQEKREC